jgi:hypothetical protein
VVLFSCYSNPRCGTTLVLQCPSHRCCSRGTAHPAAGTVHTIAYVHRPRQSAPVGTTPPPPLRPPPTGGQSVVVPAMPPESPHRIVTRAKDGFRVLPDRLILAATTTSPTPSPIPSSVRAAVADPNWRAAMEDEYGALMSNGT